MASARAVVDGAGWRALFRGNGVNVLRSAPQKALDFFAFDVFKALPPPAAPPPSPPGLSTPLAPRPPSPPLS